MNQKMWQIYRESTNGKELIELFSTDIWSEANNAKKRFDPFEIVKSIFVHAKKWGPATDDGIAIADFDIIDLNLSSRITIPENLSNSENYDRFINDLDLLECEYRYDEQNLPCPVLLVDQYVFKKNDFRVKASWIEPLSVYLYFIDSFFKPILFPGRFDIFQRNCDILGIDLPPIPRSHDYSKYLTYYYDICRSIDEFQEKWDLNDAEMCAMLYDYADIMYKKHKMCDLPPATNIWFTGAGKNNNDFEFLDNLLDDSEHIWACNERTRRGDIIIVYCTSPRSYIHSVWRASSGGIFNPFDYYHCRATICNPVQIDPISISELKNDSYFSNMPLVKKNLQGINGQELSAKDYLELLRMVEEKGGNTERLPRLYNGGLTEFGNIENEKDVEEKILIPFLTKLGYSEDDWTQQLMLKAGRKEKAIPDFVFFATGERHFENAPFIIEAKFDMSLMTEQHKAFSQCLSYARMLRSSLMGICDKERLIIYKADKHGTFDRGQPLFENHWQAIYADELVGAQLLQIIGREAVYGLLPY